MDTLSGADALVIVTEWKAFRSPDFEQIKARLKQPIIFDGRNLFEPELMAENGIEYGDVPKFVNFDYVANVARVNAAILASLASAPGPHAKARLQTKEPENNSTITWDASPGSSSYEVLWRATTSPEWEHAQPVGNVTRTTLPISKDNVIFAVRAVDHQGHRSLPVVPQPER